MFLYQKGMNMEEIQIADNTYTIPFPGVTQNEAAWISLLRLADAEYIKKVSLDISDVLPSSITGYYVWGEHDYVSAYEGELITNDTLIQVCSQIATILGVTFSISFNSSHNHAWGFELQKQYPRLIRPKSEEGEKKLSQFFHMPYEEIPAEYFGGDWLLDYKIASFAERYRSSLIELLSFLHSIDTGVYEFPVLPEYETRKIDARTP